MKSGFRLGVVWVFLLAWTAAPATAQYMFIDANGNGMHDSADRLNSNGVPTCVDIYLDTYHNRDGSLGNCDDPITPDLLDFGGYLVNLLAVNGTVTYGDAGDSPPGFINQQPTFTVAFGLVNPDGIRYSNGFAGTATPLTKGLYRMCSMTITGQTGTPRVDIAPFVAGAWYYTSFVTTCPGLNYDNTYMLGLDWTDTDGLAASNGIDTPHGITGRVTGNCPGPGTPLLGVDVCARAVNTVAPVWCATTNANGEYSLSTLVPGDYEVWVVEPLGYAQEPRVVSPVFCNDVAVVDFDLDCQPLAGTRQKYSWWRYEFDMALGYIGGNAARDCTNPGGRATYCADTLCAFLDRIYAHFYDNSLNRIDVYALDPHQDPPPTCDQKLHYVADQLLNTGANESRRHRANRELMVLLLNVVSGRLRTSDVISQDVPGRTVSQAITYFDQVIASPPTSACGCYAWGAGISDGGYGCAEVFAQQINNGTAICAGVIPASTWNIAYRRDPEDIRFRAVQGPGGGSWTFSFTLARPGRIRLVLFDISGRVARVVDDAILSAGTHRIGWDGRGSGGVPLARGVYLAQLKAPGQTISMKLPLLTR